MGRTGPGAREGQPNEDPLFFPWQTCQLCEKGRCQKGPRLSPSFQPQLGSQGRTRAPLPVGGRASAPLSFVQPQRPCASVGLWPPEEGGPTVSDSGPRRNFGVEAGLAGRAVRQESGRVGGPGAAEPPHNISELGRSSRGGRSRDAGQGAGAQGRRTLGGGTGHSSTARSTSRPTPRSSGSSHRGSTEGSRGVGASGSGSGSEGGHAGAGRGCASTRGSTRPPTCSCSRDAPGPRRPRSWGCASRASSRRRSSSWTSRTSLTLEGDAREAGALVPPSPSRKTRLQGPGQTHPSPGPHVHRKPGCVGLERTSPDRAAPPPAPASPPCGPRPREALPRVFKSRRRPGLKVQGVGAGDQGGGGGRSGL